MRKIYFLLIAFFVFVLSSKATNYVVSGECCGMNGTYIETGLHNGQPYFIFDDGSQEHGISFDGIGEWNLGLHTGSGNITVSYSSADAGTPPLTGWSGGVSITQECIPTSSTFFETSCDAFTLNGTPYNSTGIYSQILTNQAGCDSTITLNLTINNSSTSTLTETACDSYTLNGTTYNTSGVFTQTLTNQTGCDSVITLNLTVNSSTISSLTETASSSYTLNGNTYTATGTYTQTIANAAGCDSTITLQLTIAPDMIIMGTITSSTTCNGIFTDSGALTGSYQNNENSIVKIFPVTPVTDRIRVTFTAFDIETQTNCNFDFLKIYDGADTLASLIGKYCGSTLPDTITATNPSGSLTFYFKSDGSITKTGWSANVSCFTPAVNDMTVLSVVSPVNSNNLSTHENVTIQLKNNGSSTQTNIPVSYSVNGGTLISEMVTSTILSGGTLNYTFAQTADLSIAQTYTIQVGVNINNDELLSNDTLTVHVVNSGLILMGSVNSYTTCSGIFTDSGALTGSYQNNENSVLTIYPVTPATDRIRVSFTTFDVESGYDYLYVYNGNDTNAVQIAGSPFSGSTVPTQLAQVTASNQYGALTFHFKSDFIVTKTGWSANISCFTPPVNDVTAVSIDVPNTNSPGAIIPKATVKNNGSSIQTFTVTLSITGGYTDTKTVTGLVSGASQQVSFNSWNATVGLYTIDVIANLAYDENQADNQISKNISIQAMKKAYGYVVYSDANAIPVGPAYFYLQSPGTITSIANQSTLDKVYNGAWANGKWYACTNPTTGTGNLVYFDTITGTRTIIGAAGQNFAGLSYDRTTQKMYGIVATATTCKLYTINLTTGASTQVGTTATTTTTLLTLACDANGNLFSVANNAKFYSINKTTGAVTLIGNLGVTEVAYAQDMEFDHDNGDVLFWALCNNTVGELHTINKTTGVATLIATFQANAEVTGFAIPYNTLVSIDKTKINNISFTVYPNPSNGIIYVSKPENSTATIYNLQGKAIATINDNSTLIQFDLEKFASGTYIIKIQTENNIATKKINLIH